MNRFTEPVDSNHPALLLRVEIHVTFEPSAPVAHAAGVSRHSIGAASGALAVAARGEALRPIEVTA